MLLPTDLDDLAMTRRARREIVTEIVAAIDGIEQHVQPSTPKAGSVQEESDSEEGNELIDMEIQRIIRETLARKKDEEGDSGLSRRSVTIEDVYDSEY